MISEKDHRVTLDGQDLRLLMPHRQRMLLLDSILSYEPHKRQAIGLKYVGQNDPLLQGYHPTKPRFPPPLVVEALAQTCGFIMNMEYLFQHHKVTPKLAMSPDFLRSVPPPPMTVLADSRIRYLGEVYPGTVIQLHVHLALQRGGVQYYQVCATVAEREVIVGEIILAYPPYGNASKTAISSEKNQQEHKR